jgi:hypothetical protein
MRLAVSSWDELRLDHAFRRSIHCEIVHGWFREVVK